MKTLKIIVPLTIVLAVVTYSFTTTNGEYKHSPENAVVSVSVNQAAPNEIQDTTKTYPVHKTPKEWKKQLTSKQYSVLREGSTEFPFINKYWNNKTEGVYYCAACGQPLYTSVTKYKSGTGWPSFWKPISPKAVDEKEDNSFWMDRTEIVCSRCGSHLGHVFDDGPKPTGLRYCMNSAALVFKKQDVNGDGKISGEEH